MTDIFWLIEESDKLGDLSKLKNSIINSGSSFLYCARHDDLPNFCANYFLYEDKKKFPVIAYGTIPFIGYIRKNARFYPGYYADETLYDVTRFSPVLNYNYLNYDYAIFPLRDIGRIMNWCYCSGLEVQKFFIRPVGGYKTFSGFVFDRKNVKEEIQNLIKYTVNTIDPLVIVSSYKNIEKEWRFVCVDNNIIAGSEYLPEEIEIDESHDAWRYANCITENLGELDETNTWYPEKVYTIDIAKYGNVYQVVELNSFSCAGLYACNTDKVVNAVNKAAMDDFVENFYAGN